MKYYLNNDELKTMKEVENIIHTDYEIKDNFIKTDYLLNAIDELLREIYRLNQEYKDLKQEIQDNYKPISIQEQIDYNEKDFL